MSPVNSQASVFKISEFYYTCIDLHKITFQLAGEIALQVRHSICLKPTWFQFSRLHKTKQLQE